MQLTTSQLVRQLVRTAAVVCLLVLLEGLQRLLPPGVGPADAGLLDQRVDGQEAAHDGQHDAGVAPVGGGAAEAKGGVGALCVWRGGGGGRVTTCQSDDVKNDSVGMCAWCQMERSRALGGQQAQARW